MSRLARRIERQRERTSGKKTKEIWFELTTEKKALPLFRSQSVCEVKNGKVKSGIFIEFFVICSFSFLF